MWQMSINRAENCAWYRCSEILLRGGRKRGLLH